MQGRGPRYEGRVKGRGALVHLLGPRTLRDGRQSGIPVRVNLGPAIPKPWHDSYDIKGTLVPLAAHDIHDIRDIHGPSGPSGPCGPYVPYVPGAPCGLTIKS
jgi:hypothetical protein